MLSVPFPDSQVSDGCSTKFSTNPLSSLVNLVLTVPWFVGELNGYSLLYGGTPQTMSDWLYLIATVPAFLFITDMGIYWIHRWLHHPLFYKSLHKVRMTFFYLLAYH